jgi:hypothetical protein
MKPKPQEKRDYTPAPAGTHVARLVRILHVGTIITEFEGNKKKTDKVLLSFELPNEKHVFDEAKGEQPFLLYREDTFSYNEKANLRKIVEGIIGRKMTDEEEAGAFEISSLIGMACLVNVIHKDSNGKTFANIATTMPLMKGVEAPAATNKPIVFDYEHFNEEYFQKLPEYLRKKMESSDEYRTMKGLPIIELPKVSEEESADAAYAGITNDAEEAEEIAKEEVINRD